MQITHPLTGRPLTAVGFRNPRASRGEVGLQPIYPIMGGSGVEPPPGPPATPPPATPPAEPPPATPPATPPAEPPKPGAGADGKTDAERGYPLNVNVEQMTVDQQAAYWKSYARKHETAFQKKFGDDMTPERLSEIIRKQQEAEDAAKTELERAVDAARKEGAESARSTAQSDMVKALIASHKVAAKLDEKKDADVLESFETLNPSSFVTAEGTIDAAKLSKVLNRLAPIGGSGSTGRTWPATGQGEQNSGTGSVKDAGRAEAIRRGFVNADGTPKT
jgi:hypothetical protein